MQTISLFAFLIGLGCLFFIALLLILIYKDSQND